MWRWLYDFSCSHQQTDVIDGETFEDVGKARLEVHRLAAEHRDTSNVAWSSEAGIMIIISIINKKNLQTKSEYLALKKDAAIRVYIWPYLKFTNPKQFLNFTNCYGM